MSPFADVEPCNARPHDRVGLKALVGLVAALALILVGLGIAAIETG